MIKINIYTAHTISIERAFLRHVICSIFLYVFIMLIAIYTSTLVFAVWFI